MFDTDCLMMVYFQVVSVSASVTAQSSSITPPPTSELTVGTCKDVSGIVFCLSVQALIQYHSSSLWNQ